MIDAKQMFSTESLKRLGIMVKRRVDEARGSKIEKIKSLKVEKTTNMMYMNHGKGEYKGRYAYYAPIFWATVRNDQAATNAAFENKPFVTVVPTGGTSVDSAKNMQDVVEWNINDTDHVHNFHKATNDVAQHGTGVLKRRYRIRPKVVPLPIPGPTGEVRTQLMEIGIGNDYTEWVHILNYLQDTRCTGNDFFVDGCKWVCEMNRINVMDLLGMREQDGIIKQNLMNAIKKAKESGMSQKTNTHQGNHKETLLPGSDMDYDMTVVVYEMYGMFPIMDNEDDQRIFMILYCEDTEEILQIQQVVDHPYSLLKGIWRNDSYLGMAQAESIGSIQYIFNLVNNKSIENLVNNLQRYIFYLKDMFDPNDIQMKANNVFIPTRHDKHGIQNISQVLQQFQGSDVNIGSMQAILAMLNDQRQMATSKSDLYNYGFKGSLGGGMSHVGESATSANIVEQNKRLTANDIFNNIALGQENHWDKKILSLQTNLPDGIIMQINPDQAPIDFRKFNILGSFNAVIKSGLKTNKLFKYETMTSLWNFIAGILPIAQQTGQVNDFNYRQLIRDVMELNDIQNSDKILPVEQIQAPAQIPQMSAPAEQPITEGMAA